jgi:C4-dicarboxylate-specific signal transduction histidine kinase
MDREQLKGIDWLDLVAEEDRLEARAAWQESRFNGLPFRIRACLRSVAPDNRAPVELIAFGNHTAEIGDLWLFTALHVHMHFATIAELSGSISHEIVQPLSAVVANARAALNWLSSGTPNIDRARSAIERILRDGMSVGVVVHGMRELLKQQPHRATVRLNTVVEQVLQHLQPNLREKDIVASLDLYPNLPSTEADPIQIQQVLLNLVRNASGSLSEQPFGAKQITIRTNSSAKSVIVEVEGSGSGIANPGRNRETFFTSKEKDLGIGLTISRAIAEAHGGNLFAINLDNGGTRLRLTLPRD